MIECLKVTHYDVSDDDMKMLMTINWMIFVITSLMLMKMLHGDDEDDFSGGHSFDNVIFLNNFNPS